jgi:hypothetical protein
VLGSRGDRSDSVARTLRCPKTGGFRSYWRLVLPNNADFLSIYGQNHKTVGLVVVDNEDADAVQLNCCPAWPVSLVRADSPVPFKSHKAAVGHAPPSVAPQRKTGKGLMLPTARRTRSRLGRRYGVAARRTLWDFLRNVPLRKVATLAHMLAMRREGAHRAGSAAIFH